MEIYKIEMKVEKGNEVEVVNFWKEKIKRSEELKKYFMISIDRKWDLKKGEKNEEHN